MCEFVSWIDYKGQVLFLNDKKLNSRRGKELKEYDLNPENWQGHGAICWFYGIERKDCKQFELEDFSDPFKFPEEVREEIKNCQFKHFLPKVGQLLQGLALAEYEKVQGPAWAEYQKVQRPASAKYQKVQRPASAKYQQTIKQTFWKLFSIPENRPPQWR